MPRPVFDIEQYELRLITPDVFTKEQSDRLNLVTSRVNQQLDWTAQLLGMSGASYWGLPSLKADGKYTWFGLPDTPNEKRQLQATAFGVYNKDKEYSLRPAPFNRSEIKASGDQGFQIWEKDGVTILSPLGGSREATFSDRPYVFSGGSYVFDYEVEFTAPSGAERNFYSYTFAGIDKLWTRLFVFVQGEMIGVRRKGSTANYFWLIPLGWEDISDWRSQKVLNDYIGLWGNKGNNFSFDAANDALDIHGFDETHSLVLKDTKSCFTMQDLLSTVGLRATPWTGYYNTKFGFKINNSTTIYPLPPQTQNIPADYQYYEYDGCNFNFLLSEKSAIPTGYDDINYNNGFYDHDPAEGECNEDNGTFAAFEASGTTYDDIDDGIYNEKYEQVYDCWTFDEPAISELCFEYIPDPDAPCALLDLPCLEWLFDPELNNGIYDADGVLPYPAWADADNDEYDEDPLANCVIATQQPIACFEEGFCSFDDGVYGAPSQGGTEYFEPNCDPIPLEPCPIVDGGFLDTRTLLSPDYDEECDCVVECCRIDDGTYIIVNGHPSIFPPLWDGVVDGGLYEYFETCTTFDNDFYDRDPLDIACVLDNGLMDPVLPVTQTENSGNYDRINFVCPECDPVDPLPPPEPCPLAPVRVNLEQYSADFRYKMAPNVANSLVPLRVWKSRPLTCTDTVPTADVDHFNYLVADGNKGPDPFNSYRYYMRLPLEYPRNGKFWNRAISVASNQGYFSAPDHLSETQNDPEVFRPLLWDEEYDDYNRTPAAVYYNEPFLVSTMEEEDQGNEAFFEDAIITYEKPVVNPFAPALISEYDPFELRLPFTNGDWKGQYYVEGTILDQRRSGFLDVDVEKGLMSLLPPEEYPVWDESRLKRPNLEFPDSPDEASLKNYVVSYAYFCADFSASDDPVFDPGNEICWRKKEIACFTAPNEGEPDFVQITDCVAKPRPINTAYLLHPDGTTGTQETITPPAVLAIAAQSHGSEGGYTPSSGYSDGSGSSSTTY